MNTLDRLKRASIAIMRHKVWCAFSGVVACGEVRISTDLPTAATNGYDVTYNPEFVASLTDPELRFVVLHESIHKAYQHLHVWRSLWEQDKRLTNIACDHFVNLALVDTDAGEGFIKCPAIGIQPEPEYRGLSVKQIFDLLKQDSDSDPQGGSSLDDHDFEGASQQSAADQAKQAEEIQRALRQGEAVARKRGQGRGASSALVSDLLAPKVNWREQLREFVRETCQGRDESTWAKPNRRFLSDDVYLPSMISEHIGELVVIFDTSGSCLDRKSVV